MNETPRAVEEAPKNEPVKEKAMLTIVCASCKKEMGEKPVLNGEGPGVSHSICEACQAKLAANNTPQERAKREERALELLQAFLNEKPDKK